MNNLKVGFGKVNINPPLGIGVSGYYVPRFASGFLDDLEVCAMVLNADDKNIAVISVDTCYINESLNKIILEKIENATGILQSNIFLSSTHTYRTSFGTVWRF